MWYIIGAVAAVLVGFFVFANVKKNRCECNKDKTTDKPTFRTDESLNKYDKPIDGNRSHVDFDDAE